MSASRLPPASLSHSWGSVEPTEILRMGRSIGKKHTAGRGFVAWFPTLGTRFLFD